MSTETPQSELARILRDLRRLEASEKPSGVDIQLSLHPLSVFIDRMDGKITQMRQSPEPPPDEHQRRIEYQYRILPYERALSIAREERWRRLSSLAAP